MHNFDFRNIIDNLDNHPINETPWQLLAHRVKGAKPLADIINAHDKEHTRNSHQIQTSSDAPPLPETFDYDWERIVLTAKDGTIGEGSPLGPQTLLEHNASSHKKVAIIGAGAAGLCAAYEMFKAGFAFTIFEMTPSDTGEVRPGGRAYSWDWTCNSTGETVEKGGYSNDYDVYQLNPITPRPTNLPTFINGRQIADIGAMRYPYSHVTLRTYVDQIFSQDYYYGSGTNTLWRDFRNPGTYASSGASTDPIPKPEDADTLKYPTVMYFDGVADPELTHLAHRGFYRMEAGDTFGEMNAALKNVALKDWNLYFGTDGEGPSDNNGEGYLRAIIDHYTIYVTEIDAGNTEAAEIAKQDILDEWDLLKARFQQVSLWEVLRDQGWAEESAYPDDYDANPSQLTLLEMYGSAGSGTGGTDVFFWTSFMDNLRKTLHLDETQPSTFVGGTSYMLSPFLTQSASEEQEGFDIYNFSRENVIKNPVTSIKKVISPLDLYESFEIGVIDENSETGVSKISGFDMVFLTASPTAIRSRIDIEKSLITNSAYETITRHRLTNACKVAINFPNIPGQPYSQAFWMHRTMDDPLNAENDTIVTTVTDRNIRQIYTFDNMHWGTEFENPEDALKAGTLMLSYAWDTNADTFTALSDEEKVRAAWAQMLEIYQHEHNTSHPLPDNVDDYLEWAIANNQYTAISWVEVDGANGAFRMPDVDINMEPKGTTRVGGQQALWDACETSFNHDTGEMTGLFIGGEAVAWLGLSGWIEGALQTGLAATIGAVNYINTKYPTPGQEGPDITIPSTVELGSFTLPVLPGENSVVSE